VPKHFGIILTLALMLMLAFVTAGPVSAQEIAPAQAVDFTTLLPAALTLLLPIGLILLISSAMPEDQAPATTINLLMAWSIAALAYFAAGFAFQFGGIAQVSPKPDLSGLYWEWYPLDQSMDVELARLWGVIALRGWALSGEAATPGAFQLFLSHLSLVGATALIPAGALLRRKRTGPALVAGLLSGTLIYPIVGNWLWGGGWLASLGASLGLGHGLVDFGGAGLIFLTGSTITVVALIIFKPAADQSRTSESAEVVVTTGLDNHLTVYEDNQATGLTAEEVLQATSMPSAYLPILSMLGAGLIFVGWLGLATGSHNPTALNFNPAHAAINGVLGALATALAAAAYSWFTTREFNPLMTSRGLVAGLIIAVGGAPFIPIWIVVICGLGLGLLLPSLIYLFDQRLRLTDDLGIIATYGVTALVSLSLVAFFADGQAGQGWNGVGLSEYRGIVDQGVSGLVVPSGFAADWPGQLQAQLLGAGVAILWTLLISFLCFYTLTVLANAWAGTGLELAEPSRPKPAPARREPDTSELFPVTEQETPARYEEAEM
jgi:Amt family ammonium transporter